MNYKRALKVWGIVLVTSLIIVLIYSISYNIKHKNQIKEKLGLTEEEIQSVNYKQLVADIKLVEERKGLKYSHEIEDYNNGRESKIAPVVAITYYGDGYTVSKPQATDVIIYDFYINGRCVYSVINNTWLQSGERREITAHTKFTILYVVIAIMGIIEMILFIKYKKISKNNKNIEDEKTV